MIMRKTSLTFVREDMKNVRNHRDIKLLNLRQLTKEEICWCQNLTPYNKMLFGKTNGNYFYNSQ